eukprot:gene12527-13812_t
MDEEENLVFPEEENCNRKQIDAEERRKLKKTRGNAKKNYSNSLVDEDDLDESLAFFHEAQMRFLAMKDRITLRYEYYQQRGEAAHEDDVTAEDLVSQIYSTNQSCKSSRSSVRSEDLLLQGKKPTNATRRALLMAEASFIKLKQSLTNQKIKLQQELEDLDMKMEFRKLEANDEVLVEFEMAMSHTQSATPHKPERRLYFGNETDDHPGLSAPPLPAS